jgi:hypothetical protein
MSNLIHNTDEYAINEVNCYVSELSVNSFVRCCSKYIEEKGLITKHGELSKKLVANRSIEKTASIYAEIINSI